MKKKLLLILLLISLALMPSLTIAATPLFDEFVKIKNFSADFEQENTYQGLDPFSLKGKVYVIRTEKALWDYSDPVEYYLLTKDLIEHYSEELNQLMKVKLKPDDMNDPNSLLLSIFLDSSSIKDKFNVVETDNTVTLTPKKLPELKSIVLTFEKKAIKSAYTEDSSGNKIKITFLNTSDKKINSAVFKKEIPKEVNIVEQ